MATFVAPLSREQKIAHLLQQRAKVQAAHYGAGVAAINADLARLGHVDSPSLPEAAVPAELETTEVEMPEHAVPAKRRGRPPRVSQEW